MQNVGNFLRPDWPWYQECAKTGRSEEMNLSHRFYWYPNVCQAVDTWKSLVSKAHGPLVDTRICVAIFGIRRHEAPQAQEENKELTQMSPDWVSIRRTSFMVEINSAQICIDP